MKILAATVWLVLASPLVALVVYEWVNHPHHHPDIGPHGGVLVEWDSRHESLAEVVPDPQSGVVTVYVLDRWAKRPVVVTARSIHLTLATGTPTVVELIAAPQADEPPGRSSRFTSGRQLVASGAGFAGTITATANGRHYTGDFGTRTNPR